MTDQTSPEQPAAPAAEKLAEIRLRHEQAKVYYADPDNEPRHMTHELCYHDDCLTLLSVIAAMQSAAPAACESPSAQEYEPSEAERQAFCEASFNYVRADAIANGLTGPLTWKQRMAEAPEKEAFMLKHADAVLRAVAPLILAAERTRGISQSEAAARCPGLHESCWNAAKKLELELAAERKKVIEECAKVAADTPDKILCMWDRPGGPPGNGWAEIKGQAIIAQRIRSLAATEG